MNIRIIAASAAVLAQRRTHPADQEELTRIAAALAALRQLQAAPNGANKAIVFWETRIAHLLAIVQAAGVLAARSRDAADVFELAVLTTALERELVGARARREQERAHYRKQ